jgi:hypothetical protein
VTDSTVEAMTCAGSSGSNCLGSSGIEAQTRVVLLERSIVSGSWSYSYTGWIDGAPGVSAPGAIVAAITAWVRGGEGGVGMILIPNWQAPTPAPCPCPGYEGQGGNAIEAGFLVNAFSLIEPGAGGEVRWWQSYSLTVPWGRQAPGAPFLLR